jgi:ParB/RepB/Spo0J family partition protein
MPDGGTPRTAAEWVRAHRGTRSQVEFAHALGYSNKAAIGDVEQGRRPCSRELAEKIGRVDGADVSGLLAAIEAEAHPPTTELRIALADITPHPSSRPRKASARAWHLSVMDPRFGPADLPFDVSDLAGERVDNGCAIFDSRPAVRPTPDGPTPHGGIFGERRLYRALLDGCTSILCTVHDVDAEVAERMHLRENMDRADLPPLAEAQEIARYREGRTRTTEEIADELGKSPGWVHRRLALLRLVPELQELLSAGTIALGLAQALCPISAEGQKVLAERCRDIRDHDPERCPITRRDLAGYIDDHRRQLTRALWDLGDASYPGGACNGCPKRSDAQGVLAFADPTPGAWCLDRACFEAKGMEYNRRLDKGDGKRRLPVVEDLRDHDGDADRTLEELDDTEGGEPPSEPQPLPKATPKGSAADDAKVERQAEEAARSKALAKVCSAMTKREPGEKLWRLLAGLVVRTAGAVFDHVLVEACDRRGVAASRNARARLVAQMSTAPIGDCVGLVFELLAAIDETGSDDDCFILACRAAKVDYAALVEEEREKAKGAAKARDAKPEKPSDVACTCGKPAGQKGRHKATCAKVLKGAAPEVGAALAEAAEEGAADFAAKRACPITAEHIAALAAELEIKDLHTGACSPLNVWACAEKILAFMQAQPEVDVPRAKILKAHGSSGYDCADIAAFYLVQGGALTRKIDPKSKKTWLYRLVPGVDAVPVPQPAT